MSLAPGEPWPRWGMGRPGWGWGLLWLRGRGLAFGSSSSREVWANELQDLWGQGAGRQSRLQQGHRENAEWIVPPGAVQPSRLVIHEGQPEVVRPQALWPGGLPVLLEPLFHGCGAGSSTQAWGTLVLNALPSSATV